MLRLHLQSPGWKFNNRLKHLIANCNLSYTVSTQITHEKSELNLQLAGIFCRKFKTLKNVLNLQLMYKSKESKLKKVCLRCK